MDTIERLRRLYEEAKQEPWRRGETVEVHRGLGALLAVAEAAEDMRRHSVEYDSLQEDHAAGLAADPEQGESGYEDALGEMGAALDRETMRVFAALEALRTVKL